MKLPSFNAVGRYTAFGVFALSAVIVSAGASGLRVNMTRSIPLGFYRTSTDPIRKGAYVMFCPPEREIFKEALSRGYLDPGDCPSGSYPMMKKILAAKNDRVQIGPRGVIINGKLIPNSKPRSKDAAERPLPKWSGNFTVQPGDVIVMGESPVSFDSRYFGPIPRTQISTVIQPVVIW